LSNHPLRAQRVEPLLNEEGSLRFPLLVEEGCRHSRRGGGVGTADGVVVLAQPTGGGVGAADGVAVLAQPTDGGIGAADGVAVLAHARPSTKRTECQLRDSD
jgi:hypothetical protein